MIRYITKLYQYYDTKFIALNITVLYSFFSSVTHYKVIVKEVLKINGDIEKMVYYSAECEKQDKNK